MAKITLYGLHKALEDEQNDLFKYLSIPEGIDRNTLIRNILIRGGEFEALYANPYFTQEAIATWSEKWRPTFIRWVRALNTDYNPLENYDRIEDSVRTSKGTTANNTVSNDTSQGISEDISAASKYAYDSEDATKTDKTEGRTESTGSSNTSVEASGRHEETEGTQVRIHGNIGVTTSQQMLQSELDIALFNLIDQITDVFLREFIIPIY